MRLFLDPRSFPGIAVGWEGGGDGDFLAVEFEVVEVCHGDLGSLLCGVLRRELVVKQGEERGEGRRGTQGQRDRDRGGEGRRGYLGITIVFVFLQSNILQGTVLGEEIL